jgi:hypothetical protein
MKIAYFTDTFCPEINGVVNTLGYLKEYLGKKDIGYRFFAPDYGGTENGDEEHIVRFKGYRPFIYPNSCLAFPGHRVVTDAIAEFKPDLIHITTELGIGYAGLRAARELNIPVAAVRKDAPRSYLFYDKIPAGCEVKDNE